MRTTLTLDDDVTERLHELQRRLEISFKDAVNLTLRKGLEQQSATSKPLGRFIIKARNMNLRPELDYDKVGELLDQVEGVDHP